MVRTSHRVLLRRPPSSSILVFLSLCLLARFIAAMTTPSNKPKILCVGLAAVDFVATVDHFPQPDEKMRSSSLIIEGGGNAANTACAMGRINLVDVSLVTGVGDDANGNTILESIQANNVHVMAERYKGSSPFSYILNTDIEGENTRTSIHQPASGDVSVEFVKGLPLEDVAAVHFDCRYPQAAMALAKRCLERKIPYSVDVERPREGLMELLQGASVVICNSNYCNTILGPQAAVASKDDNRLLLDYQVPANRLRTVMKEQAPNAKLAVVTLGSKGSCLIRMMGDDNDGAETSTVNSEETTTILPASNDSSTPSVFFQNGVLCCGAFSNVNVVDSTGAGDAFIGGFLTAMWASVRWSNQAETLQEGSSGLVPPIDWTVLARALRIASRVASKKIEQPGARAGLPYYGNDEFIASEMEALQSALTIVL